MLYSTPDLTGTSLACSVTNDTYTIFTSPQLVDFHQPIYLTSLVIKVGNSTLVQGTDWTVAVEDYTAMSQAMNLDTQFNQVLIRSINIISTSQQRPFQIICDYQTLYPNATNVNALTSDAPRLLPIDENESNTGNVVTDVFTVNTFLKQNLIRPASGSFFADSVTLTIPTNPVTTLVLGIDYLIIGCNIMKTKATSNTSGVYDGILLTRPYAGSVSVTYHAFGGDATLGDLSALNDTINNIIEYLTNNTFLTPNTLGTNPVIASIIARLQAIELLMNTSSGGTDPGSMQTYILGLLASFMQNAPTDPSALTSNEPWNNGGNLAFTPST